MVIIANSEIGYPGASETNAFVAKEPYVVNHCGTLRTIPLAGASRSHDFSGSVPFINPVTNRSDIQQIQTWSGGVVAPYDTGITNKGIPGRVDKTTFGNDTVTLIKYNKGDGITFQKCRSKIMAWPIPNRVHARFYLEMAFGSNADPWVLTPAGIPPASGVSPVAFWGISDENQSSGPFGLEVDTDNRDPANLMVSVFRRVLTDGVSKVRLYIIRSVPRHTMVRIMLDMFLDERATSAGGKGAFNLYYNDNLVFSQTGPTMANITGTKNPYWSIHTYLWTEALPYKYNRAIFFKTAKMLVYPVKPIAPPIPPVPPVPPVLTTEQRVDALEHRVDAIEKGLVL
jgi:hypothetical protein